MNYKTKKKRLVKKIPDMMRGSLSLTSRRCGQPSCKRCKNGDKHPIYFFTFKFKGGKKVVTIPAKFHAHVKKLVEKWYTHRILIEELTNTNIELIRRGLFEE